MKVLLCEKIGVVREPVKEIKITGDFNHYFRGLDKINEEPLILNLPQKFLPVPHHEVSIMVEDEINKNVGRVLGNTGQRGLSTFKDYDKYESRYCLLLCRYD